MEFQAGLDVWEFTKSLCRFAPAIRDAIRVRRYEPPPVVATEPQGNQEEEAKLHADIPRPTPPSVRIVLVVIDAPLGTGEGPNSPPNGAGHVLSVLPELVTRLKELLR
jgi:hypothetical protein